MSTDAEAAFKGLHPALALFGQAYISGRLEPDEEDTLACVAPGHPTGEFPVGHLRKECTGEQPDCRCPQRRIALLGFYLLVGYIVHKTGTTAGIADIGRAVADIIRAVAAVISAAFTSRSP